MSILRLSTGAACAILAWTAHAHDYSAGAIAIGHPYARATVAGQPSGGGYLTLDNKGAADRLLSASAGLRFRTCISAP